MGDYAPLLLMPGSTPTVSSAPVFSAHPSSCDHRWPATCHSLSLSLRRLTALWRLAPARRDSSMWASFAPALNAWQHTRCQVSTLLLILLFSSCLHPTTRPPGRETSCFSPGCHADSRADWMSWRERFSRERSHPISPFFLFPNRGYF